MLLSTIRYSDGNLDFVDQNLIVVTVQRRAPRESLYVELGHNVTDEPI
jgi:hypothetical protein